MTLFVENRNLLNRFRKGHEDALRETYCRYFSQVELFIAGGWFDSATQTRRGRVTDFELQAELIQETFMRAFSDSARNSYDGVRPYKTFLLQIARNVVVDHFRKQTKDAAAHANLSFDDSAVNLEAVIRTEQIGAPPDTDEASMDWQRYVNETLAFVDGLSPRQQEFVKLRFQGELTLLETARRMKITRGKARHMEKDLGRSLRRHFQSLNLGVDMLKSAG